MDIKTFTFWGHYTESDDSGSRSDIVNAYNQRQALRIAALQMIQDNSWDDPQWGRLENYESLEDAYAAEIQIDAQWEDLDGKACPNCTSHNARDTMLGFDVLNGTIYECETCHFQWVPLGKKIDPTTPTCEQIDAELDAWEAERLGEGEPEDA